MNNKDNKIGYLPGYLPVVAGALAFGWLVKKYQNKTQQDDYESLFQKMKQAEQKLYQDGLKRANELNLIKKEVQTKIRSNA